MKERKDEETASPGLTAQQLQTKILEQTEAQQLRSAIHTKCYLK
jgi:hypothetical protein